MSYKKLTTIPPGELKEINTDAEMTAVLTTDNIGKAYKFTGTTGTYINGDIYIVERTPEKGDLINMNLGNTISTGTNNLYRILSINGTVAEVLAMYETDNLCAYNSAGTYTYPNAELDIELNTTFYNSLSSEAKAAIVAKNIVAYKYSSSDSVYSETTHASYADYSTKAQLGVIGSRYVYAIDVEDIETYFNNTFSTSDILTLLFNTPSAPSTRIYVRLRSACANASNGAYSIHGEVGEIDYDYVD